MRCRVALLSLLLAGPALAAPPARPNPDAPIDTEALLERIDAADPARTENPGPPELAIAAAELAEDALKRAELGEVSSLLGLAVLGRKVAHARTGEALHLCRAIAAAEAVLRRSGLSDDLRTEANNHKAGLAAMLAEHHGGCPAYVPPPPPASMPVAPRATDRPVRNGRAPTIAGGVLLGVAVGLAFGLVGVRVQRGRAAEESRRLVGELEAPGGATTDQLARLDRLRVVDDWTHQATIGLGISAGVLAGVGAGLLGWGLRKTRLAPYGNTQGAGLVLSGSF